MPKLIPLLTPSQGLSPGPAGTDPHESTTLALRVVLTLLRAAHKLTATGPDQQDPLAGNGLPVLAAVTARLHTSSATDVGAEPKSVTSQAGENVQDQSLMQLATSTTVAAGSNQAGVQEASTNAIKLLQLEVLTELVSFPAGLVFQEQVCSAASLHILSYWHNARCCVFAFIEHLTEGSLVCVNHTIGFTKPQEAVYVLA